MKFFIKNLINPKVVILFLSLLVLMCNLFFLLTGIILYLFGTGPIKGFATTLVIGILTSLFSAIFITRLVYEGMLKRNKTLTFDTKLTRNAFKNLNIDFIGKRKKFYIVSSLIVLMGIGSLFVRGLNQGVDFTGGRNYVVEFAEDVETPEPHCIMGYKMLKSFDVFKEIAQIIRYHHVMYDKALICDTKEEIKIQSYIIHLADRVDICISPDSFILDQKQEVTDKIVKYKEHKQNDLCIASEGIKVGDVLESCGSDLALGNVLLLKDIPEGTNIFNIEGIPGDGGKFIRSSGGSARILMNTESKIVVQFPSRKTRNFSPLCKATIGVVAGGGRTEKPLVKAGNNYYKHKAKNKLYPSVSGGAMNAVDHPFGNKRTARKAKAKPTSKNAPPGRKVGAVGARRTGRKKR